MTDSKTLPWNIAADDSWTSAVDAWPWQSLGGGDWGKSGECPRCQHSVTVRSITGFYAMLASPHAGNLGLLLLADRGPILAEDAGGHKFFVRCDCGEAHVGRPSDLKTGCGRWGYVSPAPVS